MYITCYYSNRELTANFAILFYYLVWHSNFEFNECSPVLHWWYW